jgi:hypothetical protein
MRKLGLALCISLLAAGCGGGNDSAAPTEAVGPTQTVTSTETVTVSVTLGPTTSASISLSGSTFQLPSKNIGCATGEGVLVCDILSGLSPEPERSCEVDWTGMEMERLGPAQPRCAGDTAYDQKSPVLAYGESWARDGFSCTSAQTGLRCVNQDGRGFTLSREHWSQF